MHGLQGHAYLQQFLQEYVKKTPKKLTNIWQGKYSDLQYSLLTTRSATSVAVGKCIVFLCLFCSPWRIVDDCGGAFAMGAIGGSVFHSIKGYRNAPSVSQCLTSGTLSLIKDFLHLGLMTPFSSWVEYAVILWLVNPSQVTVSVWLWNNRIIYYQWSIICIFILWLVFWKKGKIRKDQKKMYLTKQCCCLFAFFTLY